MTTTGQQPPRGYPTQQPSGPPPGWYPDPAAPYQRRWWSGADWTGYTMPSYAVPRQKPTEGLAIASLVTSLCGLSPVGIVLGFVARRRINRSEGARGGGGLALAGIITGFAGLAITAIVVSLAVSGVFDEVNRDDYAGEEARVADVVDRFEEAYENNDTYQICFELFTSDLAGSQAYAGNCQSQWGDGDPGFEEIDIYDMEVTGNDATAWADDENRRDDWIFHMKRNAGGNWHISEIE